MPYEVAASLIQASRNCRRLGGRDGRPRAQVSSVGVRLSENRRGSRAYPPWWVERRVSESPPVDSIQISISIRHPTATVSRRYPQPRKSRVRLPLQPRRGAIPSASSAPKGRHRFCLFSPEGAPSLSPGQRPGYRACPRFSAPKGRHSWPRGAHGLSVCRPGRAQSRFGFHSQGGALG